MPNEPVCSQPITEAQIAALGPNQAFNQACDAIRSTVEQRCGEGVSFTLVLNCDAPVSETVEKPSPRRAPPRISED